MADYNIGEVWWTQFPFQEVDECKHRPAIVIDNDKIAILAMMVTSKDKENPYSIRIDDWDQAGLDRESWARIDRIIQIDEWRMDKKIGNLSERDLKKIMQLVVEQTNNTFHKFSLVVIENGNGKYLQLYDEDWKCWLFPYYRYQDPNKETIDNKVSDLLKREITTEYVATAIHCKYSVRDESYKRYKHFLYKYTIGSIPESMLDEEFIIDNKKYSWKTINDLENDNNTMDKNDDVIAFVKSKCKK